MTGEDSINLLQKDTGANSHPQTGLGSSLARICRVCLCPEEGLSGLTGRLSRAVTAGTPLTHDAEGEVVVAADGAHGAAGAAGVQPAVIGAGALQGQRPLLAAHRVAAAPLREGLPVPKPLPRGAATQMGPAGEQGEHGQAAPGAGVRRRQPRDGPALAVRARPDTDTKP